MKKLNQKFLMVLFGLMMVGQGWAMSGSSSENMAGQGNPFTNAYDYSFTTSGTTVNISFTEHDNYTGLVAYLWNYTSGFAETQMNVSGHTATIALTNQTAGTTLKFACKFAYAGGMSVTKQFEYTVEGGDTPTPPTPTTGIDWSKIDWVAASNDKFKVGADASLGEQLPGVVNVQQPGWAKESGIYMSFSSAVSSCTHKCAIDGAGLCLYISQFAAKETKVTVTHATGTCSFTVYYVDGSEPGPVSDLEDPELTITDPSTAAIELAIDATKQITWTSLNTATPTFTSSKESVAIVSDAGVITAKAIGSATITVKQAETDTYQEATKTITVTVPGDKSKNTECSGWNDDMWASEGGYTYDFSTTATDVVLKITAMGEFPVGMVSSPEMLFIRRDGGDGIEGGGVVSGKTITWTFSKTSVLTRDGNPYLFNDNTIHFMPRIVRQNGIDQTNVIIYTVGEDCQEHAVEGVSITSTFTKIEVGQSMTMTAAVTPANATNKNVTWSITSGSEYASINSSGTLTGNAEGSVTVQVTTEDGNKTATKTITVVAAKPSAPSAAPAAPTYPAEQVKAVYSATYSADCGFGEWGSGTAYTQDTYGKKYVMTGNGYFGMEIAARGAGLNCSSMEYLHADVWVKDNKSIRFVPIHGGTEYGVTVQLTGGQWNSIDIALNEGDWANITNWSDVYQIKIDNAPYLTLWFNNVYFYTTQEKTTCALSASVKNNEGGTASVDNAEVTKGGSATFTAVADCGYSFVGWWSNTTKVSTEATYTPTDIQEDLTLVAEFAFVGPSEAATVPSYDLMTPIYTNGTPAEGVSMTTGWGQRTLQNQVSVAGHTMFKYGNINYQGIAFEGKPRNVSAMQYVHLDIWSTKTGIVKFFLIWPGQDNETSVTVDLIGCQWNSINIPLNEFIGADLTQIHQFKFDAQPTIGEGAIDGATILVQDIFFYAPNEFTLSEEDDNAENLTAFNGKVCSVTIGRTFIADGYNYTLCLPFDMTADQCLDAFGSNYKLWELGVAYMKTPDVMYLPFSEVTSIEAGKPYLFCPAADVVNPTIEGVTINAAAPVAQGNDYAKMTGIYSPYELPIENNYILGPDNWLYQSAGDTMLGLRCYFTFGSAAPAGVRARAIFHDTDVVTNLETIDAQCPMSNGKYVIDGQFVIIRNGKQYNAVGQER